MKQKNPLFFLEDIKTIKDRLPQFSDDINNIIESYNK